MHLTSKSPGEAFAWAAVRTGEAVAAEVLDFASPPKKFLVFSKRVSPPVSAIEGASCEELSSTDTTTPSLIMNRRGTTSRPCSGA